MRHYYSRGPADAGIWQVVPALEHHAESPNQRGTYRFSALIRSARAASRSYTGSNVSCTIWP
jgi:hypothetical protein